MKLGVVLVHFHTPELARSALESVRRDAADSDLDVEIVVVDNGSTPEAKRFLGQLEAEVIDPRENLGYAGGANLGIRSLEKADVWVIMNPDLRLVPGCLRALVQSLGSGAGVVGPRFFWDRPGGFMLPPAEERGRRQSLRRFLGTRGVGWAAAALRSWRRHAHRHWQAEKPLSSYALSGALMAIDAKAWRKVGPFDDGYALYFEETDWLVRAERLGVQSRYVPAARVVHHYAQSTPKEPRSKAWFEASHRRFRQRHYGRLFTAGLHGAARRWPEQAAPALPTDPPIEAKDLVDLRWLELAASTRGFPAAGRKLEAPIDRDDLLPGGVAPGSYPVRGLDRAGRELWARQLLVEES